MAFLNRAEMNTQRILDLARRANTPVTISRLGFSTLVTFFLIQPNLASASCTTTSVGTADTTVCITGGPVVPALNTSAGVDVFTMTGGSLTSLNQGAALDTVTISGGHIIGLFNNGDFMTFTGGRIGSVNLGAASNTLDMSGIAQIDTVLNSESGADVFNLNGGTIGGVVSTGSGNDTINLMGTQIGGDVIFEGGDDSFTLSSGSVAGNIFMDAGPGHTNGSDGSDNATFSNGFNLASFTGTIDGGDDISSADGLIDTLTYQNISGVAVGTNVLNWENVILDNASISFGNSLTTGSDLGTGLSVTNSGVLNVTGNFALTGNLMNSATISAQNATAGDTISVSGDFTGGGSILFDVDFATGVTDSMSVAGNVAGGVTSINVADVSSGTANGASVALVDITGTTAPGDFVLAGGQLQSGAYTYNLALSGNQWVLVGTMNAVGGVYEAAPYAMGVSMDMPSLEQRVGHRQYLTAAADDHRIVPGPWVRTFADYIDRTPIGGTSASSFNSKNTGLQFGYDFQASVKNTGQWVFGLTGQFFSANILTNTSGSINSNIFGVGTTATWYANNGFYLDSQAQVNWLQSDYSDGSTSLAVDQNSTSFGAAIEVGKRIDLDAAHTIVPQAQINWANYSSQRFTDNQGSAIIIDRPNTLIGRLGISYEFQGNYLRNGQEKLYVKGNLIHDFSDPATVSVANSILNAGAIGTDLEIGIGGSRAWSDRKMAFVELSHTRSVSNQAGSGFSVAAGYQSSW